ncbi:hypothetical protein A2313_01310 [Candidatus Roizmanbacteria bacterium RIFOXYB2_FULL_41_10]|uniref:Inositol monophosphatase n=1 Tax=Candidatus Roizmanbacteria bacterium RIFOXYA1_FULL_41_12 TaxID=1802082 RepID=A0A1F7K928_9BACT|nr:MAG: hypothetical protein A2209_02525 [Candidatus Roizmanbacteria bacterium RIFOXYA1_FULL_41_12]OGK67622.1 MAG: hypothetical protein A2377_00615 [Candidatus Roizmanbacteria bacterium RIFOXYB1_FULL_41_27]OGK68494.1 MAG: hypothetical protein A2262_01015 [Candidatus Roizmanbacteria bacterium RIFOXYA2_FULL_41_8]OGK71018.1 MAG: hypothetical protein A2313_01310 [Candidatus Roizmanbacteria bacterium RIFOXYB2_FULL_41_10]OGK71344.1 MAG: hypothetical protein A2403_01000 [Candidatus Roizmanbacteria bac
MTDYSRELQFAKDLAYEAGKVMVKYLPASIKTVKQNSSPVTEADLIISKLVIASVKKHFPDHAIIDEEIENTISKKEFVWVCDPIDGTIPFAAGVPTSMFSLGLCRNQKPVVAVCYDPYLKKLYFSSQNTGSFVNNRPIKTNENGFEKGEFVLAIPYWFDQFLKTKKFDTNLFFEKLHQKQIVLSLVESCVYSSMMVASGKVLAAVLPSANPWDRAAAKLIVENAGGVNLDEKGSVLTVFGKHGLWIVSNRKVAKNMQQIVKESLLNS